MVRLSVACAFAIVSLSTAGNSPGGGAQLYAERIAALHLSEGSVSHPRREDRANILSNSGAAPGSAGFRINTSADAATTPFTHFFEESVGSGHMSLTLREDWRGHLRMARRDLGVRRIRGHGLLDDDMSVSMSRGKNSFYNVDSLIDFLISIGMRPILELSFMPSWLTSGDHTVCHYKGNSDPPKSYDDWGDLIYALGKHIVDRYGEDIASSFYFEVWNEPNDQFFQGTQEDYWKLYSAAALGLKNASQSLRVGGPATCCPDCWITDFVEFARNNSVPFDFVSTHAYSSGQMEGLGSVSKVYDGLQRGRAALDGSNISRSFPWLITEFGDSCNQGVGDPGAKSIFPSAIHDMVDQASYTIAAMAAIAGDDEPTALSYWAVSDVFEEEFFPITNVSFHGMFGLINLNGIPKPTYRAYQMLHESGDTRLPVEPLQPKPVPNGTCGEVMAHTDVYGGDVTTTAEGVADVAACCKLCSQTEECDVATFWSNENMCGLKKWANRDNTTDNPDRVSVNVTLAPFSSDQLCAINSGVLAVRYASNGTLDLFVYNHAAFASPIVDCDVTVDLSASLPDLGADVLRRALESATVRRIDEDHANPLAAWVAMGAPDYTTAAQDKTILAASQLKTEPLLADGAKARANGNGFTIRVPSHGVAAVRMNM